MPGNYADRLIADRVVPDGATVHVLAPSPVGASSGHASPDAAIDAAGSVPSSRPDVALLVVVNDPDRATATAPVLRALRKRIGGRAMDVLVATGSHRWTDAHRRAHEAPLVAAAGPTTRFLWHDGLDEAAHAVAGGSRIDRHVLDAHDIVAIGSVEPHWFAGLTGAHKTLTVGVLFRDDIESNHRLALAPGSRPLALDGNPLHAALLPILAAVGDSRRVLAVQHVEDRWFAGAPLDALLAAADAARGRWRKIVERPLDFVITHVEPPLSRTLYQAEKGVKLAEHAVRDGGAIVLDAACEDGVGPSRFVDLLRHAHDETAARALISRDGYRLGDHKAVRLRALTDRGVKLALLSPTFNPDTARIAGFDVLRDHAQVRAWLASHVAAGGRDGAGTARGADVEGAIVEDGGHVVLEVRA